MQQALPRVLQPIVDLTFYKLSLTIARNDRLGILGSHDLNSDNRKMRTRMTACADGAQQMVFVRRANVVSQ